MKKILVIGLCGESVFLNTDHFNEEDETIIATSKHIEPGGKGFNQCVALKRLSNNRSIRSRNIFIYNKMWFYFFF